MIFLPDVNVWVALVVAEHTHAMRARRWAESAWSEKIAFCRITQMGLLRLLTNRHVMGPDVCTPQNAWGIYDRIAQETNILFATEPSDIEDEWRKLAPAGDSGPNLWTDAYLAAFAQLTGYTLVTFDRGFRRYKHMPVKLLTEG